MRISDWSSDVCSSDLPDVEHAAEGGSGNLAGHDDPCGGRAVAKVALSSRPTGWCSHQQQRRHPAPVAADQVLVLDHAEGRSEEHTSELQSLMRISYAVFCLKKKNNKNVSQLHVTRL